MDEITIQQELLKAPTSTVTHVHKLLTKIATNPDEPKFRRLKTTSRLFRERFGDAVGALARAEVAVRGEAERAEEGDLCAREGADGVEAALRLVDARLAMSDGELERARGPAPRGGWGRTTPGRCRRRRTTWRGSAWGASWGALGRGSPWRSWGRACGA